MAVIEITKRDVQLSPAQITAAKNNTILHRVKVPNLRFGKLALAVDADVDGSHIAGLNINLFSKFWPELIEAGFVHILRTPVVMVTLKGGDEIEFFTERDFKVWEAAEGQKAKGWTMKYYKGLSSWKTKQFAKFLENPDQYLFKITTVDKSDTDVIDLVFNGSRADDRKVWLETGAEDLEQYITA